MSTDIAKTKPQQPTIGDLIRSDTMKAQFEAALPKHITPDRFVRVAMTAINRVPALRKCTQESLMQCLLDCSAIGLEPDGRRAHLIPYGDKCTLILDYKGMVELVRRSGDVRKIHADIVCEDDEFEADPGEVIRHKIDYRKTDRGPVYAVYAIAWLKDGARQAAIMSVAEVNAIRKRSKAGGSGPWVTDWNEMAKKTAFRRLCKWLTLSPEIRDAIEIDDRHTGIVEVVAHKSGIDRAMAMLDDSDAGPTADDLSGNVDHAEATETPSTTTK